MSGRAFRWIVVGLLLALLVLEGVRALQQREAAHIRLRVETLSTAQAVSGRISRQAIAESLRQLRRAAELDPVDPAIPMLEGGQYMLLKRPEEAVKAYRRALEVEARPEIYFNLGNAHLQAGQVAAAREAYSKAVMLDWQLQDRVPPADSGR